MPAKLYVGNLSFDTTERELRDHFAQAGTVSEAVLTADKFTGKSRGFAFVTMSTPEEALRAIALLYGQELRGLPLTINEAPPEQDFTGGGPRRSKGSARPGGPSRRA